MPDVRILAYGSLRVGEYNYKHIEESCKPRGSVKVLGLKMYDLGYYPGVIETKNLKDVVFCDVIDVEPPVSSQIDMMELGAGYYSTSMNLKTYGPVKIYIYRGSIDGCPEVPEGDWSKYLKEMEKIKNED